MKHIDTKLIAGSMQKSKLADSNAAQPISVGQLGSDKWGGLWAGDQNKNWAPVPGTVLGDKDLALSILSKLRHWWPLGSTYAAANVAANPYRLYQDLHGGMEMRDATSGTATTTTGLRVGSTAESTTFTIGGGLFTHGRPAWTYNQFTQSMTGFIHAGTIASDAMLLMDAPAIDRDGTENIGFQGYLFNAGTGKYRLQLFWEYAGGTNVNTGSSDGVVQPNAAQFVSIVRNDANKTVAFHVNSDMPFTQSYTASPSGGNNPANKLVIGNCQTDTTYDTTTLLSKSILGAMQDIALYDKPLTYQEIAWLYNEGRGRSYDQLWVLAARPQLWTPARLPNKVVWMKADSPDNVVVGNTVTRLENHAGFHAATPYGGNAANVFRNDVSTLNGMKVLSQGSAATQGHFLFNNTQVRCKDVEGLTVICLSKVIASRATLGGGIDVSMGCPGSPNVLMTLGRNTTATVKDSVYLAGRRLAADAYAVSNDLTGTLDWMLNIGSHNYATGAAILRINGVSTSKSSFFTTGRTAAQNMNYPIAIGGLGNSDTNNKFYNSEFAEVIVLDRVLTTIETQKVEGYLAHKWGLQRLLPESHPYKSSAPTV